MQLAVEEGDVAFHFWDGAIIIIIIIIQKNITRT